MRNPLGNPIITSEIDYYELNKLLKKKLPQAMWTKATIYLVDRTYQLISKAEMERFLKQDLTDLQEYVAEFHDCDDFSWALLGSISAKEWSGIAFGFAFSNTHAFNIFVSDEKEVYIVEPQRDLIWKVNEIPKQYKKYFVPIRICMM